MSYLVEMWKVTLADRLQDHNGFWSPVIEMRLNSTNPSAILVSVELANGSKWTASAKAKVEAK